MAMDPTPSEPKRDPLPVGLHVVLKDDCPTCQLVVPVLRAMEAEGLPVHAHFQDDGAFLEGLALKRAEARASLAGFVAPVVGAIAAHEGKQML